jgi:hypothetical protein
MTPTQFEKFLTDYDNDLAKLSREVSNRGEDEFDPFLFAKALLLKLRVGFTLMGKQLSEQRSTASDLQYQHEQWMGQVWPREVNG